MNLFWGRLHRIISLRLHGYEVSARDAFSSGQEGLLEVIKAAAETRR